MNLEIMGLFWLDVLHEPFVAIIGLFVAFILVWVTLAWAVKAIS